MFPGAGTFTRTFRTRKPSGTLHIPRSRTVRTRTLTSTSVSFQVENDDFPVENDDFSVENDGFSVENDDSAMGKG